MDGGELLALFHQECKLEYLGNHRRNVFLNEFQLNESILHNIHQFNFREAEQFKLVSRMTKNIMKVVIVVIHDI